jgi:hypothetical protein
MREKVTIFKEGIPFSYFHPDQTDQDALDRLNNILSCREISDKNYNKANTTVVCFGTFDLFHELHKRLIKATTLIGASLLVYVYGKSHKVSVHEGSIREGSVHEGSVHEGSVHEGSVKLSHSIRQRISNVTNYASTLFPIQRLQVSRMTCKHIIQLGHVIKNSQRQLIVFGGADQFQDYYKLLDLCFISNVPIVMIDRGEGLCSSDLRKHIDLKRLANVYGVDTTPHFWSKYKGRLSLDDNHVRLWKYNRTYCIDELVKNPILTTSSSKRIVVCLPGRTPCDWNRARKILRTNEEMLQKSTDSQSLIDIYLVNYTEDNRSTTYHINRLNETGNLYFSQDALWIAKMILMPRCLDNSFWKVTFWGRSRGSIFAVELENAFRSCCLDRNYSLSQIKEWGQQIAVLTVSNLARFDPHRLFTTISITGQNDKKARQCIPELADRLNGLLCLSDTHAIYLVTLPREIWTDNHGTIEHIEDDDCHYTPLFISPRLYVPYNDLSDNINQIYQNMVNRPQVSILNDLVKIYEITKTN